MVRLPLTPAEVERGQRLGALLRRARGERSMLETALDARISPETLRKIESGRVATPSFPTIAAVAEVLGLSLDVVWAEISPPESRRGTTRLRSRPTRAAWPRRGHGRRAAPCHDVGMERVLGVGGYFLRAADPAALGCVVPRGLGLDVDASTGCGSQEAGPTVFAAFQADTDYLGARTQQTMVNFRVRRPRRHARPAARRRSSRRRRDARTWLASAGSAGSPTRRATGSSCGSPADDALAATTVRRPTLRPRSTSRSRTA